MLYRWPHHLLAWDSCRNTEPTRRAELSWLYRHRNGYWLSRQNLRYDIDVRNWGFSQEGLILAGHCLPLLWLVNINTELLLVACIHIDVQVNIDGLVLLGGVSLFRDDPLWWLLLYWYWSPRLLQYRLSRRNLK